MKKRIMIYSERDEHGNERGVKIPLEETATAQEILEIDADYLAVGWGPRGQTKRIVEAAKKETEKA